MSGRETGLWVICGLTVAFVAGVAAALLMKRNGWGLHGDRYLVLGAALCLGAWAAIGWCWYLTGGTVS